MGFNPPSINMDYYLESDAASLTRSRRKSRTQTHKVVRAAQDCQTKYKYLQSSSSIVFLHHHLHSNQLNNLLKTSSQPFTLRNVRSSHHHPQPRSSHLPRHRRTSPHRLEQRRLLHHLRPQRRQPERPLE
jgi:hypothetical protein